MIEHITFDKFLPASFAAYMVAFLILVDGKYWFVAYCTVNSGLVRYKNPYSIYITVPGNKYLMIGRKCFDKRFLLSMWYKKISHLGTRTAKTKCRKFETNIPRKGILGPQSQFPHSCVCEQLYIPTMGLPVLLEGICGLILGIYKSLKDTWMRKLGLRPRYSQKRNI